MRRTSVSALVLAIAAMLLVVVARGQQVSDSKERLMLHDRLLLDARADGFMSIAQIKRSPDGRRFAVIACGYECTDNLGFLFNTDGSHKRNLTAPWDRVLQTKLEWSADSKHLYYYRVNSSGAEAPASAPRAGWVEVEVNTLRKRPAVNRILKCNVRYGVFNLSPGEPLNVRAAPGAQTRVVGALNRDATGVIITGLGRVIGSQRWVPITQRTAGGQSLTGWVNQNYLYELNSN